MPKAKTLRFAAGSADDPRSGVWRVAADRNDVYVGSSKAAMRLFKLSLHGSGVWTLAATTQSAGTFENGNRRAKRWTRPLEQVEGITAGPSIVVPHMTFGVRKLPPGETNKNVHWYPSPRCGELVEFRFYFVRPDAAASWSAGVTEIGLLPLAAGHRLFILASAREAPRLFLDTMERFLRDHPVRIGGFKGGNMLWFTESRDQLRRPTVIDLPVNVQLPNPAQLT